MSSENKKEEVITHSHNRQEIIFKISFGAVFTVAGLVVLLLSFFAIPLRGYHQFPTSLPSLYDFLYSVAVIGVSAGAFLAPGLWAFTSGYAGLRRKNTYGSSQLVVQNAPVPVGDRLDARLQVSLPSGARPDDGFHIELAEWSPGGGGMSSGGKGSKQWSDTTTVHGRPTANGIEVPISMDLPHRQFTDLWTIEVTAAFENHPDYRASFDLPVTGSVDSDLLY